MKEAEIRAERGHQLVLYVERGDDSYGPVQTGSYMATEFIDDFFEKRERFRRACLQRLEAGEISPVAYYRQILEMAEADLAARVGVSRRKVRRHATAAGFGEIDLDLARRYAEVFGVTVVNLFQVIAAQDERVEVRQETTGNAFVTKMRLGAHAVSPVPFTHKMAAHCESGTVTALLRHAGLDVTESLVFGISGAIFFGYFRTPMLPFPTIILRNKPGRIRIKAPERLGARFRTVSFRDPGKAARTLDELLARGITVGAQVDYFYMSYLPEYTRAHFNAHYVNVVGKEDGAYLLSDSYFPKPARLDAATFATARFARGTFAPKGMLFWPEWVPGKADLAAAVRRGIKDAVFYMLRVPLPFFGVRGIRYFARKVQEWPQLARDLDHLSHEVMMIAVIFEERGTGGGGFRYLYATFLQEAARILGNPEIAEVAKAMMENGDRWRDVSIAAARMGKRRELGPEKLRELGEMILVRADAEQELFGRLAKLAR